MSEITDNPITVKEVLGGIIKQYGNWTLENGGMDISWDQWGRAYHSTPLKINSPSLMPGPSCNSVRISLNFNLKRPE